jgi:hypothetical protein
VRPRTTARTGQSACGFRPHGQGHHQGQGGPARRRRGSFEQPENGPKHRASGQEGEDVRVDRDVHILGQERDQEERGVPVQPEVLSPAQAEIEKKEAGRHCQEPGQPQPLDLGDQRQPGRLHRQADGGHEEVGERRLRSFVGIGGQPEIGGRFELHLTMARKVAGVKARSMEPVDGRFDVFVGPGQVPAADLQGVIQVGDLVAVRPEGEEKRQRRVAQPEEREADDQEGARGRTAHDGAGAGRRSHETTPYRFDGGIIWKEENGIQEEN